MARPYSEKFLLELSESTSDGLGVQLAKLCVKANLPATYVAVALETTRTTVYSWFRGQGVREEKRRTVETFIQLMQEDLEKEVLPAKTMKDARQYIHQVSGLTV
jgi:hypothetical protein